MPSERSTGLKPEVSAPPSPEQLKETTLPMSTLPKFVAFDRKVRSHPETDPSCRADLSIPKPLVSPADLDRSLSTPGASLELLLQGVVTESAVENHRVRKCTIYMYLEDESVHVEEP